ncbi:dynein light chain Tctex-type 5 [Helicoverpa armigera]|uniref:dynein light chain Tctex-type 5 n=1 Tax=Helicoverpa armigera TaxID=29058 RepID=UPI000B372C8C|nr:hypothetical protein B5X24_HaOG209602 [Helicoverpa armigera]
MDADKKNVGITESKPSQQRASISKSAAGIGVKSSAAMGKTLSRMKVRRQSFGFGGVAGIRAEKKTSQVGTEYKRPPILYLPTYQLDPRTKFHVPSVEKTVNAVLDDYFDPHKYSNSESPGLTVIMAGEIMRHVKAFSFDRYRIIAVVTMAQRRSQSYYNAVSFLWDHERDNLVDMHRESITAFVQVTVFGIYLD